MMIEQIELTFTKIYMWIEKENMPRHNCKISYTKAGEREGGREKVKAQAK